MSCEFNGAIQYWAWWERNRSFARFWQFARRACQDKDSPAKINNKKERDYLIRKIQGLSLDELALFCLDKVLTLSSIHITLLQVAIGSKHRGIFVGLALPQCWLHCWIIIVRITRIVAAGCCASHVIFWFFAQTLFLGIKSIKSIPRTLVDTIDTFRRSLLTPHVLSAFTVISNETRKYFAIRVCTGYYRVGHSPLLLYYELLVECIKFHKL